jgi:hypothetical protein
MQTFDKWVIVGAVGFIFVLSAICLLPPLLFMWRLATRTL